LHISHSEKAALQALKASDWHLEGAFDVFYSQPQIAVANTRHLEELYNRYKGGIFYSLLRQSSFYALSLIFFPNFTCAIMLCLDCSEPDADMIMVEGISQICNDLQVIFWDFFFFECMLLH
jgi:DCN1-like protein 1/2